MQVIALFPVDLPPAKLEQPGKRPLGHPAKPLEVLAGLDPLPDNPSHALIAGENTKVLSRKLAARCTILPGVESV